MGNQRDRRNKLSLKHHGRNLLSKLLNSQLESHLNHFVQSLIACCCTYCHRLSRGLYAFCQQNEIIGTRYLVEPNFHYSERIFWALLLVLAAFGSIYSVLAFVSYYERHLFHIIVENQPQLELLNFPTVAVCEARKSIDSQKIQSLLMGLNMSFELDEDYDNFEALMNAITFVDYHRAHKEIFATFYNYSSFGKNFNFFHELDFKKLANQLRHNCSELFTQCMWRRERFNCCEYFLPLQSLTQSCYALNSQQTEEAKFLDMKMGKYMPHTQLELIFNGSVRIFLLDPDDVPQLATSVVRTATLHPGHHVILDFELLVSLNDPGLYEFGPQITQCLPPNYPPDKKSETYKHVSYTSCLTDCLRMLQFETCGCIKHTLNEGTGLAKLPYCQLSGYVCLERNKLYTFFSMRNFSKSTCDHCLQACEKNLILTADLTLLRYYKRRSKATIKLIVFPKKRIRRLVVRNKVDLFVFLGGLFSIFMGVSVVQIIDLIYCIVCALFHPS